MMAPLHQRFIENMQLRGYSARAQEADTQAVCRLAQRCHRRPDKLSEEKLRRYFLYLANEKKWGCQHEHRAAESSSSTSFQGAWPISELVPASWREKLQ